MLRFLATVALQLLASAIGLFMASVLLPGFTITAVGFGVSVLVFALVGFVSEPLLLKLSLQYIPALRGGIALVTTFVSLVVADVFTDGLTIRGVETWVLAPLIVWVCVLLAGVVLPLFLFKKILKGTKDNNRRNR